VFAPYDVLREQLRLMLRDKTEQGRDVAGLAARVDALPDDYQAIADLAAAIDAAPLKPDWPYVEPSDLDGIRAERTGSELPETTVPDAAARAEAGFLGSVAGCILGKPVELFLTMAELRPALERIGEWPLRDYISERLGGADGLGRLSRDWPETVRERIRWVAADDDINYSLLGLLVLEQH
jgi:hypothetical protein